MAIGESARTPRFLFSRFAGSARALCSCVAATLLAAIAPPTHSQTVNVSGYADVAPNGFGFFAAADSPVLAASLRVFADADGLSDITDTLSLASAPGFGQVELDTGLVNLQVRGAAPQTTYYAQLSVDFGAGPVFIPPAAPLVAVETSMPLAVEESASVLQFNALIAEAAVANNSLILLSLAAASHPLSGRVMNGLHAFDLNNAKDGPGDTLAIASDTVVTVENWLGAGCAERAVVARQRRVPQAISGGALQYAPLTRCFFADTNCDDTIDVLDLQYLLGFFQTTAATCGFNDDLDADGSGVVDVLDLQSVLNRFGDVAPF